MKTKRFDSVKMMRDIRETVSKDLSKLSIREKIDLLEKEFPEIKIKKRRPLPLTVG
ncbi:MAG: hypothetical protein HZA00_00025 [Nitrospinae bacterium]|nr:hypothetical protein [Nitrospinota bacterium]